MSAEASALRHAKIAWRCRRGMRELDLLLARFLANGLDSMADAELDSLERLLAEPDQDILAWITGSAEPADADLGRIVDTIRSALGNGAITDG